MTLRSAVSPRQTIALMWHIVSRAIAASPSWQGFVVGFPLFVAAQIWYKQNEVEWQRIPEAKGMPQKQLCASSAALKPIPPRAHCT